MSTESNRRPTIRTVATVAGVSTATVSYVLHGKQGIPEATAARVLAAVREVGYRPSQAAQAMRTGRTQVVLISLQMLTDPWSLAVSEAISARSRAAGQTPLILADGDWAEAIGRMDPDVAYIDSPETVPDHRRLLGELVDRGQRLLVFSEELEPDGFDVIRSLARPGAQLVLSHLIGLTDDVACLTTQRHLDQLDSPTSRVRPYVDAVAARLLRKRSLTLFDGTPTGAFETTVRLLQGPKPPRGLFCITDFVALAAMQAAQVLGLVIGKDVLITGLGHSPQADQSTPTLTTAGPDDLYARQAEILLAAADAAPIPRGEGIVHEFPWRLRPGGSTGMTR